jgi:hypothetical protein
MTKRQISIGSPDTLQRKIRIAKSTSLCRNTVKKISDMVSARKPLGQFCGLGVYKLAIRIGDYNDTLKRSS